MSSGAKKLNMEKAEEIVGYLSKSFSHVASFSVKGSLTGTAQIQVSYSPYATEGELDLIEQDVETRIGRKPTQKELTFISPF